MSVDQEKFVDVLLDRSLSKFSEAEPRTGLEERIVAGIASAELPQPVRHWRWVLATAMLALLLGAAWLMWPATSRRSNSATNSAVQRAKSSHETAVVNSPAPGKEQIHTANSSAPKSWIPRRKTVTSGVEPSTTESATKLPKLEVFPSPAPLSEEETALLAFVRQTPRDGLVALSQIQQREQEEQEKRMEIPAQMNFNSNRSDVVNTR